MSWRLVLDLQATQSTAHAERGVARYVKEHVRALRRRGEGEALLLNPHLPFPRRLEQDLLTTPLLQWNTQSVLRAIAERADGPLAYFWMSPFELSLRGEGDLPPHAIRGDIPTIATLYDLIPMRMMDRPPWNDEKLARRTRARAEQLHHVDLVLTISEQEEIFLDGKAVSMEELKAQVAELAKGSTKRKLALNADTKAPFGTVIRVLDVLREAGVKGNLAAFMDSKTK